MKIAYFSDLHVEFGPHDNGLTEADYVIFAGDIGPGLSGLSWIKHNVSSKKDELLLKAYPFFVPGNHEYYGGRALIGHDLDMRAYAEKNGVNYLNCNVWQDDQVRIVGATLWTDFMLDFDPTNAMLNAFLGMADYRQIFYTIGGGYSKIQLQPEHTRQDHASALAFITQTLYTPFEGKTIVVTHHGCSKQSIHPKYAGHFLNPAFVSDLEPLIRDTQPDLWIHGHVHNSMDYYIGKTRVVCNPKGYPEKGLDGKIYYENSQFNPNAIVEI